MNHAAPAKQVATNERNTQAILAEIKKINAQPKELATLDPLTFSIYEEVRRRRKEKDTLEDKLDELNEIQRETGSFQKPCFDWCAQLGTFCAPSACFAFITKCKDRGELIEEHLPEIGDKLQLEFDRLIYAIEHMNLILNIENGELPIHINNYNNVNVEPTPIINQPISKNIFQPNNVIDLSTFEPITNISFVPKIENLFQPNNQVDVDLQSFKPIITNDFRPINNNSNLVDVRMDEFKPIINNHVDLDTFKPVITNDFRPTNNNSNLVDVRMDQFKPVTEVSFSPENNNVINVELDQFKPVINITADVSATIPNNNLRYATHFTQASGNLATYIQTYNKISPNIPNAPPVDKLHWYPYPPGPYTNPAGMNFHLSLPPYYAHSSHVFVSYLGTTEKVAVCFASEVNYPTDKLDPTNQIVNQTSAIYTIQ